MIRLAQAALALFINAIPIGGLVTGQWTPATTLTLYWCESLLASILLAVRIAFHRRRTRKRGHFRAHFGATTGSGHGARPVSTSFLGEFLTVSVIFTLAHGLFLVALFAIVLKTRPDTAEVLSGFRWMALAQFASCLLDLTTIADWPFADLKARAGALLGRVGLMHFVILGGMFLAAFSSRPTAVFSVFAALKTLADLAALLPTSKSRSEEVPRRLHTLFTRLGMSRHWKSRQPLADWWRDTTRAELAQQAHDEETAPSPQAHS